MSVNIWEKEAAFASCFFFYTLVTHSHVDREENIAIPLEPGSNRESFATLPWAQGVGLCHVCAHVNSKCTEFTHTESPRLLKGIALLNQKQIPIPTFFEKEQQQQPGFQNLQKIPL